MRTISVKLLVLFGSVIVSLSAQAPSGTSSNPFGGDPFGGLSVDSILPPPVADTVALPQSQTIDPFGSNTGASGSSSTSEPAPTTNPIDQVPLQNNLNQTTNLFADVESSALDANVQNAVIEGIQITADKGSTPDEKVISGYFIFRDKPSSYFYEVKLREKKIIFEFNDTKTGAAPVPSVSESPIKGFTIVSDKVDINKTVKGLKPEYHNLIRVIFDLEAVPEIKVNDEYSIITFSFKWTTNSALLSKYTMKDPTKKIIWASIGGVGALGVGGLVAFLVTKEQPPEPLGEIDISDIPVHTDPTK